MVKQFKAFLSSSGAQVQDKGLSGEGIGWISMTPVWSKVKGL